MSAFVCGECLADEGLARFVARAASADACSFCTQAHDSPIAASVSDVAKFMRQCLEQDYGHPTADRHPPGAWANSFDPRLSREASPSGPAIRALSDDDEVSVLEIDPRLQCAEVEDPGEGPLDRLADRAAP